MGFEIVYHYCEWTDGGGYNRDEVKYLKRKLGDPFEEVPDSKLASVVTAQMARRDILVIDVEIHELVKRKVSFAPTKAGIKIRNKNYSFDATGLQVVEDCVEEINQNGQQVDEVKPEKPKRKVTPLPTQRLKVLRSEVYNPSALVRQEALKRRLPFTIGKEYPIYEEKPASLDDPRLGLVYKTKDDNGSIQIVHAEHFVPKQNRLLNDDAPYLVDKSNEIELSYGDEISSDTVILR